MKKHSLLLRVILLLFAVSPIAHARKVPTEPVQLSVADRREILGVLDLDSTQVRSMNGFRVMGSGGTVPAASAMVKVTGKVLAPRIESGREITCYKRESTWTCDLENALEMLYVTLPENCPAEASPSIGGRFVRILRDNGPSVQEALAIVELICTSEQMAEQAWALGHRVTFASRNVDGELEVMTVAPGTDEAGLVFVLEERCERGTCRFIIGKIYSWVT